MIHIQLPYISLSHSHSPLHYRNAHYHTVSHGRCMGDASMHSRNHNSFNLPLPSILISSDIYPLSNYLSHYIIIIFYIYYFFHFIMLVFHFYGCILYFIILECHYFVTVSNKPYFIIIYVYIYIFYLFIYLNQT